MSQPSPTGYAMANEVMTWDAFGELINFDLESHWPAAGHDMQGVGNGGDGSPKQSGNDKRNKERLSHGMPGLPQCPSPQQLDQQHSHHAVGLPLCLHGGTPEQVIAPLGAAHGFRSSSHMDDAGEIDPQKISYLHEPDATQSGLLISPPSMLSASHCIGSELSSSASIAGTSPPPKALHVQSCACISYVEIGYVSQPMMDTFYRSSQFGSKVQCRYPGCPEKMYIAFMKDHERSHFHVEGQYSCKEEHCTFTTKRWLDLKRHSSSKHCTSLKKPFNCPVLWCKYSGDNGFARKDKLNNHVKTVHAGMSMPGKANQPIKPKVSDRA